MALEFNNKPLHLGACPRGAAATASGGVADTAGWIQLWDNGARGFRCSVGGEAISAVINVMCLRIMKHYDPCWTPLIHLGSWPGGVGTPGGGFIYVSFINQGKRMCWQMLCPGLPWEKEEPPSSRRRSDGCYTRPPTYPYKRGGR